MTSALLCALDAGLRTGGLLGQVRGLGCQVSVELMWSPHGGLGHLLYICTCTRLLLRDGRAFSRFRPLPLFWMIRVHEQQEQ